MKKVKIECPIVLKTGRIELPMRAPRDGDWVAATCRKNKLKVLTCCKDGPLTVYSLGKPIKKVGMLGVHLATIWIDKRIVERNKK